MDKNFPKRKDIRSKNLDYNSPGMYFVTLCTESRKSYFWNSELNPQTFGWYSVGANHMLYGIRRYYQNPLQKNFNKKLLDYCVPLWYTLIKGVFYMQYLITFLEGIITFISPCLLPMLPVYVSYFSAGGEKSTKKTFVNALGFVLGFTVLFVAMGALAGTLGGFLIRYQRILNIVCGAVVIFFGLNFMGVFKIKLAGGGKSANTDNLGFFSSFLFGLVFSVSWTPCVSAFLGSALMLASQRGHMLEGIYLLLVYSLGLGIPFVFSALLIDKLKGAFNVIKKHYKVINSVCGIFLVIIGILMATGLLGRFLALLN